MDKISVIIPCYNEQEAIPIFYDAMEKTMGQMEDVEFELLFVDDGSKDRTLEELKALAEKHPCVKYISFSRNFGKEAAIYAGLQNVQGDYTAIMDVDLQDPPELLPEMYQAVTEEGYDSVATRRADRKGEPVIRSLFAKAFYRIMNRISSTEMMDGARDYRLMNRTMVEAILEMGEYNRFSKGIFGWVGFKTKWISFDNVERSAGETKWSFWKLLFYSLDGITGFSVAPLAIASVMGIIFCIISILMVVVIIGKTIFFADPVPGWPSLICVLFLVSGIQLFCLGIIGQYLSKTYLESKRRPIYIVREENLQEMKVSLVKNQTQRQQIQMRAKSKPIYISRRR